MLAKSHAEGEELDKAEAALQRALVQDPKDFHANLGLAVLLLKKREGEPLKQAKVFLDRAQGLLPKDAPRMHQVDYALARSVYHYLDGDAPRAKRVLEKVVADDDDGQRARALLDRLER
jgi:hypothetical protein